MRIVAGLANHHIHRDAEGTLHCLVATYADLINRDLVIIAQAALIIAFIPTRLTFP